MGEGAGGGVKVVFTVDTSNPTRTTCDEVKIRLQIARWFPLESFIFRPTYPCCLETALRTVLRLINVT